MELKTILLIEDDSGLIELLSESIADGGYQVISVQNAGTAQSWLESNSPHLMVLDYSLPDMNGHEFIASLKQNGQPVPPFIVTTGQGDERIAVAMMKLGARDYVIKDNHFLEMIPMVISKVSSIVDNENRLKMAEQALIESNQFNNQIIKGAQEGIIVYGLDMKYQVWNPYMEKLTGIPASEILGKHPSDFFPFLEEAGIIELVEKALHGETVPELEFPFHVPDSGKSGWTSDQTATLYNTNHDIIGAITTVRDVTQRKRMEDEQRAAAEKYRLINEKISDVVWLMDFQGKSLFVSQSIEKFTGYSVDEYMAQTISARFTKESAALATEMLRNEILQISTNKNLLKDYRKLLVLDYQCKNGNIKSGEVLITPYFNEKNILSGIHGVTRDITERKKAEEKMLMLAHSVRSIGECVSITDLNDKILFVNSAFLKTYQYDESELLGNSISIIQSPNNSVETLNGILPATMQGLWQGELLNLRKDGSEFPVHVSTSVIKDEDGNSIALIGVARDITENKKAERKIRLNTFRLNALYELSMMQTQDEKALYNFVLDKSIAFSESEIGFLGFVDEENDKVDIYAFSQQAMKQCEVENFTMNFSIGMAGIWAEPIRQRKPIIINDFQLPHPQKRGVPDGHVDIKNYASIPYFDGDKIISILAVANKPEDYDNSDINQLTLFMDGMWKIVKQHKSEKELIVAKDKAEESDRLKSAFLANMSHEIRTPLNGIIGFSELLNDPDFDQQQKAEFTQSIVENGNNLLLIINDIMDLSMIESGQITIRKKQFSVHSLLSDLEKEFKIGANSKGIELHVSIPANAEDVVVDSDIYRTRQIFNNLIGNAVKFTGKGKIEIGYHLNNSHIEFYVTDSGIGITPENLKAIFERFRQVDTTKTRLYGGNGLGLAISKNLVELLGGTIWVESEFGRGSKFSFSLPANTND